MAHEQELRDYVIDRVLKNIPEARLNGGRAPRLPGNVNISFPGLEGETILLDLDMHNICASTGSACNSDSLDPQPRPAEHRCAGRDRPRLHAVYVWPAEHDGRSKISV